MRIGGRSPTTIRRAMFQRRHYRAVGNMVHIYRHPWQVLRRYLLGTGEYPWDVAVRTPLGWFNPTLFSHHDLLTLNEIFCRIDYRLDPVPQVVVDVGSNIGLSGLYFLTRAPTVRCHLYEPVPQNLERLEANLGRLRERATLNPYAVGDAEGEVEFGIEASGRYGGINVATGHSIMVRCRSINSVLEDILAREARIDLLKIDTEGAEERTLRAIATSYLDRIGAIYLEARPRLPLLPGRFRQEQHGEVVRLFNSKWQ
jgi:FkbM family methyltransferase